MICLNSNNITILSENGDKKIFDSLELQNKIKDSYLSLGIKENWIAEDIANAIELALDYQSQQGITILESDINLQVVTILENMGYCNIAQQFKQKYLTPKSLDNIVKQVVYNNFKTENSILESLFQKVLKSLKKINLPTPPPSMLILELAKYYHTQIKKLDKINNIFISEHIQYSPFILRKNDIINNLLQKHDLPLLCNNIIKISSISKLFPSIKLEIVLAKIPSYFDLKPILTEMMIFPSIGEVANEVNCIIEEICTQLKNKEFPDKKNNYPKYIFFSQVDDLIEKYFGISINNKDKKVEEDIINYLLSMVKYKIIPKIYRRNKNEFSNF